MRWREKLNELVPEGEKKFIFEDVKRRPSIFGEHGKDKASYEEHATAMKLAVKEEQKALPNLAEIEEDPNLAFDPDAHYAKLRATGLTGIRAYAEALKDLLKDEEPDDGG